MEEEEEGGRERRWGSGGWLNLPKLNDTNKRRVIRGRSIFGHSS